MLLHAPALKASSYLAYLSLHELNFYVVIRYMKIKNIDCVVKW